jgi:hypothetical protein
MDSQSIVKVSQGISVHLTLNIQSSNLSFSNIWIAGLPMSINWSVSLCRFTKHIDFCLKVIFKFTFQISDFLTIDLDLSFKIDHLKYQVKESDIFPLSPSFCIFFQFVFVVVVVVFNFLLGIFFIFFIYIFLTSA